MPRKPTFAIVVMVTLLGSLSAARVYAQTSDAEEKLSTELRVGVVLYYLQELHDYYSDDDKAIQTLLSHLEKTKDFTGLLARLPAHSRLKILLDHEMVPEKCVGIVASKTVTFFNGKFSDEDLNKMAPRLKEIQHLKKLDFSNTQLTGDKLTIDGTLAALKSLNELTDLDLSNTPLTDVGLIYFTNLQISKLWLNGAKGISIEGLKSFVKEYGHREIELHLATMTLGSTKSADEWVVNLQGLWQLSGLDLSDTNLTDDGLPALTMIKDSDKQLRQLILSGNKLTNSKLKSLEHFGMLEALDLSSNKNITDGGLARLNLPPLSILSLAGTGHPLDPKDGALTHAGISDILEKSADKLRILNLSGTSTLTAKDSKAGKAIRKMTSLEALNIAGTGINDEGLIELWEKKGRAASPLPSLLLLDISGTDVTNHGLVHENKVGMPVKMQVGMPMLKVIRIGDGDTKVTNGGISRRNALVPEVFPLPLRYNFAKLVKS